MWWWRFHAHGELRFLALWELFPAIYCLQCRSHDLDPDEEPNDHEDAVHHHLKGKSCNLGFHHIRRCGCAGILKSLICPHRWIPSDIAETGATIVVLCILEVLPGLRAIVHCFLILISLTIVNEQWLLSTFQAFVMEFSRCESSIVELFEFL